MLSRVAVAWAAETGDTVMDELSFAPTDPEDPSPPSRPQPQAPEPSAPRFGEAGEFVVTGASAIGIWSTSWDASEASSFSASFSPGIDVFFVRNLSLGLDTTAAYSKVRSYGADGSLVERRTTVLAAGIRAGLNVPLGKVISWYPRVGFGVEWVSTELELVSGSSLSILGSPLGDETTEYLGPWLTAFAPVIVHVRSHLFLGAGPSLFHGLGRARAEPEAGGERTSIGVGTVIGGWWGGREPRGGAAGLGAEPESGSEAVPPHRFGEQNQIVISNESTVSARWRMHSGSGSSSTTYVFAPAIDYFWTNRWSLGLAVFLSDSQSSSVDPVTRLRVNSNAMGGGAAFRLGADAPLTRKLSLYPRASISFSVSDQALRSGSEENAYTATGSAVTLDAPLLFHVAPHAFIGFGPSFSQDISRRFRFASSSAENESSTIGCGLVVGGWID